MVTGFLKSILSYLLIVVIAILLLVLEGDFLWKIQEQNLFLCTWLFFKEQMVVPGGFLTWVGTFFTQFLYYPWIGVTLLAAWWILLAWLIAHTFRLEGWWCLLTIVPVLFILVTIVDTGYWIYFLKLRGHFFVTTIGATAVTALLWAFRAVQSHTCSLIPRLSFVLLTCVIGYPLLGIYGLAATLLMSIWVWHLEWKNQGEGRRKGLFPSAGRALAVSVTGVLSVIVVPLICYRHVYYQTNLDNIYFAELPLYFIQEEYQQFYVPFYLLLLFFVVMSLIPFPSPKERGVKLWEGLGIGVVIAASIAYTVCFWYRDENYHHELAMQHCIDRLDWEGVLREATTQEDEPTRAIVVMRNIALARLGRQANEMYLFKNGSKKYNAPFDMSMMMVNGPLVYYHYGMVNCCYRLCTEMGVEFEWRAEHLKYLTRCALLNGEWQLARKFIGLLRETLFFDDWADGLSQLLEKPDEIARTPEMGYITHMMHYDSEITADQGYVEKFIMERLSASTYTDDPIFQEQALLASLFTKDVKRFWRHFSDYVKLHPDTHLPKHVQEAVILFGTLEERPNLDTWPFDSDVRESCRRFFEIMPRFDNMEVGPVRKAVGPQFGHTYYYDYFLMNNPPQY